MIGIHANYDYSVTETLELFKIPWEWYNPEHSYDVIIGNEEDFPEGILNFINLSEKNYFEEISRILNECLPHCKEPVVDILIDELREKLKQYTLVIEIPPVPWGYDYTTCLTHDVDITSVRERRFISVGYAIYQCLKEGLLNDALKIFAAKFGIGKDPWNCFSEWMELEDQLEVRSTFFFLPCKDKAGKKAPKIRAGGYDPDPVLISELQEKGWEVGVHGIDNWIDFNSGITELNRISPGDKRPVGNRVHWLMFEKNSWKLLDDAHYDYDSTIGYNEDIGFGAGTLQIFKPENTKNLLELPLHIQDVALFDSFCWIPIENDWKRVQCLHLTEDEAKERCSEIVSHAKKYGGVVTLLWHHERLATPHSARMFYKDLIQDSMKNGAWPARAQDCVEWFRNRRKIRLNYIKRDSEIEIIIDNLDKNEYLPPYRVRVHIKPDDIGYVNSEYVAGDDYIDIKCDKENIIVREKLQDN